MFCWEDLPYELVDCIMAHMGLRALQTLACTSTTNRYHVSSLFGPLKRSIIGMVSRWSTTGLHVIRAPYTRTYAMESLPRRQQILTHAYCSSRGCANKAVVAQFWAGSFFAPGAHSQLCLQCME